MTAVEAAFRWIVGVLSRNAIPFQIVGGLAARAYGASRPLADIDLYVPGSQFPKLVAEVRDYVTFGPEHYVDDHWDLTWMALDYQGQKIEIGAGDTVRIFDRAAREWVDARVDFETFEEIELWDLSVPVMPRARLLAYKRSLGRAVDLQDIAALSPNEPRPT